MSQSQTKACKCEKDRRCDPCAESDLAMLLRQVKGQRRYQEEEAERATTIIDPSPAARERASGFHRRGERGLKVGGGKVHEATEADIQRISARVAAYKPPEAENLGWCCPTCGYLADGEAPLVDDKGIGHCPRVGCDDVVKLAAL